MRTVIGGGFIAALLLTLTALFVGPELSEASGAFKLPYMGTMGSLNSTRGFHSGGWDYNMRSGTPVLSVAAGKIVKVVDGRSGSIPISDKRCTKPTTDAGNGNYIEIDHGSYHSMYFHLGKSTVLNKAVGTSVARGQQVGRAGATGCATGAHLHLQIIRERDRRPVNPYNKGSANSCSSATYLWADCPAKPPFSKGIYLYQSVNYAGRAELFGIDDADLRNNYIGDNTASSAKLVSGCGGATLYELINYSGNIYRVAINKTSFFGYFRLAINFDNKTSSIDVRC